MKTPHGAATRNLAIFDATAQRAARDMTLHFSTSFGSASRLFDISIRQDIYNIYALVRLADEIVDSYRGDDAARVLADLQAETLAAVERGFSSNMAVHAFQLTARRYGIGADVVRPFFDSMAMDLQPTMYDRAKYEMYIYGSAEVVGLMCLRVFVAGDDRAYANLRSGAQALGRAYQKVNFLRDIAEDQHQLDRNYFPELQSDHAPKKRAGMRSFKTLDEVSKELILRDIRQDFSTAEPYIDRLPATARAAVAVSFRYYGALLQLLAVTPAETIMAQRIRLKTSKKLSLLVSTTLGRLLRLT